MPHFSLAHLADHELVRDLSRVLTQHRASTAALLAHLAEFDARRLYAPAGYPSMFQYCVQHLHFSEDAAYRRIQVARVARQYPDVFAALESGRLHLSAVLLLAPHLTATLAPELLAAAAHRSKEQIALLLAERFPRPDLPTQVRALPSRAATPEQVAPPAASPRSIPME